MLRHVVMFKWADGVDEAHVAKVAAALDNLVETIPEIGVYRHGPDVGVNDGNFDYVVVGDFGSLDDYIVYRDDSGHREMISTLIAGHISERASVQYEVAD